MKTLASILTGAALVLSAAPALARPTPTGEEQLAQMLAGRVAGQPTDCITTFASDRDVQVVDRVGLVYKAGNTVWVARARDPDSLRDRDVLIVDHRSGPGRLCSQDTMRTVDRYTGALQSVVFLDDFVPYRRG